MKRTCWVLATLLLLSGCATTRYRQADGYYVDNGYGTGNAAVQRDDGPWFYDPFFGAYTTFGYPVDGYGGFYGGRVVIVQHEHEHHRHHDRDHDRRSSYRGDDHRHEAWHHDRSQRVMHWNPKRPPPPAHLEARRAPPPRHAASTPSHRRLPAPDRRRYWRHRHDRRH